MDETGSSPPARGTRARGAKRLRVSRFIPACAGNTMAQAPRPENPAVHPRLRGEHVGATAPASMIGGSSPPARGTRIYRMLNATRTRFIPACAGNTVADLESVPVRAVHPRLRGEHDGFQRCETPLGGSSPPARGTRRDLGVVAVVDRFIPACAGNTRCTSARRGRPAVHPRLRGEHCLAACSSPPHAGSSPPARGTRCNAR